MLRGLTASVILHAGIIASSLIVLPYAREAVDVIEVVPVDIVNISEVTNIAPVRERVTDLPPPEEPEPQPEEPDIEEFLDDVDELPDEELLIEEDTPAPPPPPETEESVEDVVPEEPEEKEPEPEEEEEPAPEEEEISKPDALDELLESNVFESENSPLLDKAPQERAKIAKIAPKLDPEPPEQESSQVARRGVGEKTGNEARIEALIKVKMEECWGTVADLPDPERLAVTVRINLDPDGVLIGDAELISPRRRPLGDRFMGQAIDRALRAARKCQPFNFPREDYEIWNEITMNFRHDGFTSDFSQ